MRYKVLTHVCNDRTGNQYNEDDIFNNTAEKFDADVIANWLDIGAIEEAGQGAESASVPKRKVTLKGKSDK